MYFLDFSWIALVMGIGILYSNTRGMRNTWTGIGGMALRGREGGAMKKLTKFQLAELAAGAMNLLSDLDHESFTERQTGAFHKLVAMLPAEEQPLFWNSFTLQPKDLTNLAK